MYGVAQIHPVPRDLVAPVADRAGETTDELLHEVSRGDHVERLEPSHAEGRHDVVVRPVLERDLGAQLLDAPDLPAVGVAHRAAEQLAQRQRGRAHLRSPPAPGIRQMTWLPSQYSTCIASSSLASTSSSIVSATQRTASNGTRLSCSSRPPSSAWSARWSATIHPPTRRARARPPITIIATRGGLPSSSSRSSSSTRPIFSLCRSTSWESITSCDRCSAPISST